MGVDLKEAFKIVRNVSLLRFNAPQTGNAFLVSSEIWRDSPSVVFVVRRFGCKLCRGNASKLYAKREEFEAMGVKVAAVGHEDIGALGFQEGYWQGLDVFIDPEKGFFNGLGMRWMGFFKGVFSLDVWKNIKSAPSAEGDFKVLDSIAEIVLNLTN